MTDIFADSSFYICLLRSNRPRTLNTILSDRLNFCATPAVALEIRQHPNHALMQMEYITDIFPNFDSFVLLHGFSRGDKLDDGESELILHAYLHSRNNSDFRLVLDDGDARTCACSIPNLKNLIRGTAVFIGECCCDHKILGRDTALDVLQAIRSSDDCCRIPDGILTLQEDRIRKC